MNVTDKKNREQTVMCLLAHFIPIGYTQTENRQFVTEVALFTVLPNEKRAFKERSRT